MKIKLIFLCLFFCISCNNNWLNSDEKTKQWIIKEVETTMVDHDIPAISIGVIQDGALLLEQGFGVKKRGAAEMVNEHSIYQIASQSKTFTGIIANHLIMEGKLDPETSIVNYLSDVLNEAAKERLKAVKLKQVLQHSAGISNTACKVYRERVDGEYWLKGYSKEELINDLNQLELVYEPGTQWDYSNSGYAVLGFICEIVTGEKYADLLTRYITDTYQLHDTNISLQDAQKANLLTPYKPFDRQVATRASLMGMATPGSAIYSSSHDLSVMMMEQIKAYQEEAKQSPLVLTNDVAQTNMGETFFYGYGLIMEKGKTITYGHGGDADGFGCEYVFIPSKGIGVVLLSSSGGDWMKKLAFDILGKLQGDN